MRWTAPPHAAGGDPAAPRRCRRTGLRRTPGAGRPAAAPARVPRAPAGELGCTAVAVHAAGAERSSLELEDPLDPGQVHALVLGQPLRPRAGWRRPGRCTGGPGPDVRPGLTRPSRSYWRSVCGCIPASCAATEMTKTGRALVDLHRDVDPRHRPPPGRPTGQRPVAVADLPQRHAGSGGPGQQVGPRVVVPRRVRGRTPPAPPGRHRRPAAARPPGR